MATPSTTHSGMGFLTSRRPALIAMIHVGALPGTPRGEKSVAQLAAQAVEEAKLLTDAGVDAILLENMHDLPYLNRAVGPEIVAGMTAVCSAVRAATKLPLGVQVLAGANQAAIAVAQAAGCQFIRAEGFVFAHVADEGLMAQADAGPLLRYRRAIGATGIAILADIKKKHSAHAITADVDLAETARAAEFFGADGVIVTGTATGSPADPKDVAAVRKAVGVPVLVGSGVTPDNLAAFAPHAHAIIVGSFLKKDGDWQNAPDRKRVESLVSQLTQMKL
ncbi:Putative sgc region protein SgcQ [Phycisphaerae bacterium RAS2]|nr:Putative sgc region protein SgcQ [Phycisphaerae bacterium RAS2]